MGFFSSGSSKTEFKTEVQPLLPPEEELELSSLPKPRASTVITEGVTLTGRLCGEGSLQVEGTIEGEIELEGSVAVSATGLVKGPITAGVVRIAGTVVGDISAHEHLRLEKTGKIQGDVSAASLVVEDGGRLNGRSTMLESAPPEPVPAGAPADGDLKFGPGYSLEDDADETV